MPRSARATPPAPHTVTDALAVLDAWAPFAHAAEWDNVGLLAGRAEWPATRAVLAIDLTDDVAREVLRARANLLVVYHPPIFKGIRNITPAADTPTTLLPDLLAARVAIIAQHTALDAAAGGTNDVLLDAFDLVERYPLEAQVETSELYKLVTFVPPAEAAKLRRALAEAGAGRIGHYDECSFELAGRGSFRGDASTHPTIGRREALEFVNESRLEMVVPRHRIAEVVRALHATHSYEEPAFDLHPLHTIASRGQIGLGRVGVLRRPQTGDTLLAQLAQRADLTGTRSVGRLRRRFARIIAAAGAFGVRSFTDPGALVLTGEFKHHDALTLQKRGVTAVHLGHWASEQPVLPAIAERLRTSLRHLHVRIARSDRCPFQPWSRGSRRAGD